MFEFTKSAPVMFIGTTMLALTTILAGTLVTSLDQATARQCASHNWPADAHDAHIEWCRDNGYSVR